MSCVQILSQNSFGAILFLLPHLNWVLAIHIRNNLSQVRNISSHVENTWTVSSNATSHIIVELPENYGSKVTGQRVRRDSGSGGKYTDAAKMAQVKVMRLFLQMFKNLWAATYVGGAHPFHHEVPKPVVFLFKDKIATFFFPNPQKTETEDNKDS